MKIVEYKSYSNIIVEFQDEYKFRVRSMYFNFKSSSIKNPYYPSVYGIGITGIKYPRSKNCKNMKEYETWKCVLRRSFDKKTKIKQPTYNEVSCCKEWLNYENFYEWVHNQPNFDKWLTNKNWALDKDILVKKNKIYSPETCCLIPPNVNCLFLKREAERGEYPIGVRKKDKGFAAVCRNPFVGSAITIGMYSTPEEAFKEYKKYKEKIIKKVAQNEFKKNNIAKNCFNAMMKYEVEISD